LLYDGHGSTRQLIASDQSVQQNYNYDAYGTLLQGGSAESNPGTTPTQDTSLLYTGEMFDTNSQMYYNRARWYNTLNGTFNRVDPYAGNTQDPQSLHKYTYCHNNPVNAIDPSGQFTINTQLIVTFLRATLLVLNIYGVISNTRTASNYYLKSLQAFQRGEMLASVAYAAAGVFYTGLAALNLFGIRSFISGPPNISGGFGLSFEGGALAISFQELAISNPPVLTWIAGELGPAVIGVFASRIHIQGQGNLLGEPGGRSGSGKTNGVLDDGSGSFPEFQSGETGPAKQFWGQRGFTGVTRTHVEAHAAAWMRIKNITYAILRINNTVCPSCDQNLPTMLGPGRSVTVIDDVGNITTYVGK
jgi:RHS repeat-associated protein